MPVYAKIFSQIFDSSIAENYKTRHVFEDLLKLADKNGVVDMTPEAICRRTNVPLDEIKKGLEELSKPDKKSRTQVLDGRRIVLLSPEREWGWKIVNYEAYRSIQDEEARRAYFRDAKRRERDRVRQRGTRKNRNRPQARERLATQTDPTDLIAQDAELPNGL